MKAFISLTSMVAESPDPGRGKFLSASIPRVKDGTFLAAAIAGAKAAGWEYDHMSLFTAAGDPPAAVCRTRIRACDAFVGVLGIDRGSEPREEPGISYVEFEYGVAVQKMPRRVLMFKIDSKTTAFTAAQIAGISPPDKAKQAAFRQSLECLTVPVADPEDLRREVELALRELGPFESPRRDLTPIIRIYEEYIEKKEYDDAWAYFNKELNYELDFARSEHQLHRSLLSHLFPDGVVKPPALRDAGDIAGALNALARAYKNIGNPGAAVQMLDRQLAIPATHGKAKAMALGNFVNALRLTGRFRKAEDAAGAMLTEVARLTLPITRAYSLYWNGVLRAGRGSTDEAILLLRQAQSVFEDHTESPLDDIRLDALAGIGRVYAHLAQQELWLDNPKGALCYACRARELAGRHGQPREEIFSTRLIGQAKLMLGDFAGSDRELKWAIARAQGCRYFEEQLTASICLAELEQRRGLLSQAFGLLNDDLRAAAERGPYAMQLSDFYDALCQVYRSHGVSRRREAVEAATKALHWAQPHESDYHYHWGFVRARKHLLELGQPAPKVPPLAPGASGSTSLALSLLTGDQGKKAQLRAEFTGFFRLIEGHYRYAPQKFQTLLREEWEIVRRVAVGREAAETPPRFIEVHLGHPCNLACGYCRGELRPIPKPLKFLDKGTVLGLLNDIHRNYPQAFVRFSGVIGEPLLHPDVREILEAVGKRRMKWGLTTNGVFLGEHLHRAVLTAEHVHVSVDAGSGKTYRELKGGQSGDFEKVLANIGRLAKARSVHNSRMAIVVSFLFQDLNYAELPQLAQAIKVALDTSNAATVDARSVDSLEIKMQHYDARRGMTDEQVNAAYDVVERVRGDFSSASFHVVVVQSREQALRKVRGDGAITFEQCYANQLGLNPTVDPLGAVQMCCQYYQPTLAPNGVGNVNTDRFRAIWAGGARQSALRRDPRGKCTNCSPSDEFVNRFVQFLRDAHRQDDGFLDWVEKEIAERG